MSEARIVLSRFRACAGCRAALLLLTVVLIAVAGGVAASAAEAATSGAVDAGGHPAGGEASLKVPDLGQVDFSGINGRTLLMTGLLVSALGLLFGLVIFVQLRNLPVHDAMLEISELIYETCKTYLITQGKFILFLELFIGAVMVLYFYVLVHLEAFKVVIILLFSLIGIGGSYGVAWFGIRITPC